MSQSEYFIRVIKLLLPDEPDLTMLILGVPVEPVLGTVCFKTVGPICEFNRLWVDPATRRQGVASALLRHIEQSARAAGCESVSCIVRQKNSAAAEFYRARGYARCIHFADGNDCFTKPLNLMPVVPSYGGEA